MDKERRLAGGDTGEKDERWTGGDTGLGERRDAAIDKDRRRGEYP